MQFSLTITTPESTMFLLTKVHFISFTKNDVSSLLMCKPINVKWLILADKVITTR